MPDDSSPTDLEIGDRITIVCQGTGDKGDPIAFINGWFMLLKYEDGTEPPTFGETCRVKIADVQENKVVGLVIEREGV